MIERKYHEPQSDQLSAGLFALLERLSSAPPRTALLITLASFGVIAGLDYLTGYEAAFSIFYVIPICTTAWVFGQTAGLLAGMVSALAWSAVNIAAGEQLSSSLIELWNIFTRLITYTLITVMIAEVRRHYEGERRHATVDDLTGALKSRAFRDRLDAEVRLARRDGRSLTLTYMDLDGFKAVNDRHGHGAGDALLTGFAKLARDALGPSDVFARVGGDEFVALLVRDDSEATEAAADLHRRLRAAMPSLGHPVTCSMGAVIARDLAAGELVRRADALMYEVKRAGKDALRLVDLRRTAPTLSRAA